MQLGHVMCPSLGIGDDSRCVVLRFRVNIFGHAFVAVSRVDHTVPTRKRRVFPLNVRYPSLDAILIVEAEVSVSHMHFSQEVRMQGVSG